MNKVINGRPDITLFRRGAVVNFAPEIKRRPLTSIHLPRGVACVGLGLGFPRPLQRQVGNVNEATNGKQITTAFDKNVVAHFVLLEGDRQARIRLRL